MHTGKFLLLSSRNANLPLNSSIQLEGEAMSATTRSIFALGLIAFTLLVGCASTPVLDKVVITSDPPGASVSIDSVAIEGKTPLTAMVGRKAQYVILTAPGCEETKVPIARETNNRGGGVGTAVVIGVVPVVGAAMTAGTLADDGNGNAFKAKPEMFIHLDRVNP
jgi:hypothetical protein